MIDLPSAGLLSQMAAMAATRPFQNQEPPLDGPSGYKSPKALGYSPLSSQSTNRELG